MGKSKNKPRNKMSRQPPLPPGLPPRPFAHAGNYDSGDSYRSRIESPLRYNEPAPRFDAPLSASGDMYQFKGRAERVKGSSWRPENEGLVRTNSLVRRDVRNERASDLSPSYERDDNSYRPSYNDRDDRNDYMGRNDYNNRNDYANRNDYRDRNDYMDRDWDRDRDNYVNRNEGFTFRAAPPPGLDFAQADTYRARSPGHGREYAAQNNENYRSNNSNFPRGGARGGYRGRGGPRMASERDFLKTNRAKTPELMPGMEEDQEHNAKYKAVEDMSDSEEKEMDFSNSEDEHADQPRKKQARTTTKAADGDSVPRWSNPDPYTVLPPIDASDRKKKDVVKLIRKARVTHSAENATKIDAAADDFISLDFGDDEFGAQPRSGLGVEGAPTQPRSSQRDNFQQRGGPALRQGRSEERDRPESSGASLMDEPRQSVRIHQLPPRPALDARKAAAPAAPGMTPNSKPSMVIDLTSDPNLSSRKRTNRDEIKEPPRIHESTKGKSMNGINGDIVKAWKPVNGASPNPWVSLDHSDTASMGIWLHKEIMDFYHYVKPRDFEQFVRQKLVEDLREKIKRNYSKDADVLAFGSFPAGLYLPTADMDLVCCSSDYLRGGRPVLTGRNQLYRFANFLRGQKLALNNQVEIIAGAKVPLVKYVCATTGLKVDISFENDTGLIANKTFQDWKTEFPAMPILVTLVKHFLAMRGLNEPVNGGIGGFSVICLVVSLLQLMPQVQSGTMVPEHNLGEILMEFLDLYGNQFDSVTNAIVLKPPGYVNKKHLNVPYKGDPGKFSIIDPNRPDNDISGGAKNTGTIRKAFSIAFNSLQQRMGELHPAENRSGGPRSLLECIIGGNYRSFELQREHLAHVHERLFGPINRT